MTDGGTSSRTAVVGAALGLSVLASRTSQAQAPRLLVFLQVSLKQRAFQGLLQSALPGVNVTAVGRIFDFDRALADAPDALLPLPLVLSAKNLAPQLQCSSPAGTKWTIVLPWALEASEPQSRRAGPRSVAS